MEALQPQKFLKMEQPKERSRSWNIVSLLSSDVKQKKHFGLGGIDKEGDCNDNTGNNNSNSKGLVQDVLAKGE